MRLFRLLMLLPGLSFQFCTAQNPLSLYPGNRHLFQFQGKPLMLVTTSEDYGALYNPDFNYTLYFDSLQSEGMNVTRIFSGLALWIDEPGTHKYHTSSIIAPQHFLVPWQRSEEPGYVDGGPKFDLDKWDDRYFHRLKDAIIAAAARGVFIEFTLFANSYHDTIWRNSPLFPANNIQRVGPDSKNSFQLVHTLKDTALVQREDAFVTKIVQELNSFDNLYYEVCNEPYNEITDTAAVDAWHRHIVRLIKSIETRMPKQHLIATNESIVSDPDVSIANYHYVHVRNMPDMKWLYRLNKALSMDETLILPWQCNIDDMRVEAWDFIMQGGGGYNNLNWDYTLEHAGGTELAYAARRQLQVLRRLIGSFGFTKMFPDDTVVKNNKPDLITRVLSSTGNEYLIYLHHSQKKGKDFITGYRAIKQSFQDSLQLKLPEGRYELQWMNPSSGEKYGAKTIFVSHKNNKLASPVFVTDIIASLKKLPVLENKPGTRDGN